MLTTVNRGSRYLGYHGSTVRYMMNVYACPYVLIIVPSERGSTFIPKSEMQNPDRDFGTKFPKRNFHFGFRGAKIRHSAREETKIRNPQRGNRDFDIPLPDFRAGKKRP